MEYKLEERKPEADKLRRLLTVMAQPKNELRRHGEAEQEDKTRDLDVTGL